MTAQLLRTPAADLGALMSGRLALLATSTLPGLESLAVTGVATWVLTRHQDGFLVSPLGASAEDKATAMPLPLPPAGVIALVAPTVEELQEVGAWWADGSGQPAPLIIARDAAAALPLLIRQVVAELERSNARCVQLERSLATTRQDYEETRIVMASVSRTLGHRPPAAMALAVALEPSGRRAGVTQPDARLFLRQPLGRKLEGLAALAVHVGMIGTATSGPLRIRVFGEESDRIAASWIVPMEEVVEGWLVLDLPTPLGPQHEGALLEITADVAGPDAIAFSLEEKWAPAGAACALGDGSSLGHALAMRLWTARIGDRFVVPPHWDWNEAGSSLPRIGVPQSITPAEHRAARILAGNWVWLDQADARPGVSIIGAMTAVLAFPRVTLAGADVLRVEWSVTGSAPAGQVPQAVFLGVWALDPTHHVRGLDGLPATAAFSGWRGVAEDGTGLLTLSLPVSLGPAAQLVLAAGSQDPAAAAQVEITRLSLVPTSAPSARHALQVEAMVPDPGAPQRGEAARDASALAATLGRVELHQHLADGRGYQHLDLIIHDLAGRGHEWSKVRFKLAINRDGPLLEFRRAAGWPDFFARWPGSQADRFGPLLRVRRPEFRAFADALAHPRDTALIANLLELLGHIAAEGTRAGQLDAAESAQWVAAAEAMRDA
jgi:hypothetical protein